MNFNIFNSLILAGVIQGFVFGLVVWTTKKYKSTSNYLLATLIVVYSLNNLQYYLQDADITSYEDLFLYYFVNWADLLSVLLYLYVFKFLFPTKPIPKKAYYLFSLFLLTFSIATIYKVGKALNVSGEWLLRLRHYLDTYAELLSATLHVLVLVACFKMMMKFRAKNKVYDVENVRPQLQWLRKTLIGLLILTLLWIVLTFLYMKYPGQISFYPLWIGIAILVYWLGHIGIYRYGVIQERKHIRSQSKTNSNVKLPVKTKRVIIERLKQYLVEERQFLNPNLSLEQTAEVLELSQGHLSKIINQDLQMSFKDYVNGLRVEEAKRYLKDKSFSNYTLLAVGLEAGFNSKTAFNTSFKKITGVTPSQFKREHAN
ncbi:MAG: AraC family transcriptional regulator [Bacteroidota bacterium]